MKQFLTDKTIFFRWQTIALLLTFIGLRCVSYATAEHAFVQAAIVFVLLMVFGVLYFKNPDWAWLMLLTEMFLGGSGHLLTFFSLSLRSVLFIAFIFLWLVHILTDKNHHKRLHIPHTLFYMLLAFGVYMLFSVSLGMFHDHALQNIVHDLVPFLFFFLVLPMYHLFHEEKTREYLMQLLVVFVIGSALFSLYTFILFAGGFEAIHGEYYSWFRDLAMGKVTDMFTGFYRIVTPEHLLLIPTTLILGSLLMRKERHHHLWRVLLGLSLLTLTLNLSRTYFLALFVGFIVLLYKHQFTKWFTVSVSSALLVFVLFTGIHYGASQGQSPGWDLFGLRFASIAEPQLEESAHTRSALLGPIASMFSASPIFGTGLGAMITFEHPVTRTMITTPHFDWGYFELATELGILGLLLYLAIIGYISVLLIKKIRDATDYHDVYVGLLASLVGYLVMTVTTPALFHVYGVFFVVILLAVVLRPNSMLDGVVRVLYRTFHRHK